MEGMLPTEPQRKDRVLPTDVNLYGFCRRWQLSWYFGLRGLQSW